MDKAILDIVNDFALWKGNSFMLAQLVSAKQKELTKNTLIEAGFPEAAEAV